MPTEAQDDKAGFNNSVTSVGVLNPSTRPNITTPTLYQPPFVLDTLSQFKQVPELVTDIPLSVKVLQVTKEKNWKGAYVDLSLLFEDPDVQLRPERTITTLLLRLRGIN